MLEEFVTVGKLGRTRDLKGELYITPLTDFPERFSDLSEIYIKDKERWKIIQIDWIRFVAGRPVIKFENINSPEEAARLTNREIALPKDQLVELPEDTYYIFDLIGCKVFEKGTGCLVGEIINVEQYPANDIYVIKTVSEKEVLFPAVNEFVKSIDINKKKIIINTAGILEE